MSQFVKGLRLPDATAIVAGGMIGSGIFVVSQDIAITVGSPGVLLGVWLLTAFMTLAVALAYGELAAMFPKAGGQYVYLREAYSPLVGFLFGWTSFTVIQSGTIAAVAVAFAKYLGVLSPWVSTNHWLIQAAQFQIGEKVFTIGLSSAQLVAILVVVALTYINTVNLQTGKWVQNIFTSAKILSLAILVLLGVFFFQDTSSLATDLGSFFQRREGEGWSQIFLFAGVWTAMVGSLFSSDAWNNITFVAGEVEDPQKNIPRALFLGVGGVVLLYFLANCSYLAVLSFDEIASAPESRVAAAAMGKLFPWGPVAMSLVVMVSTFGCLNGIILAGPRLYWAMAQDQLFFKAAGELGEVSKVPAKGLWLQCAWAIVLTLSGTYGDLLDYVIFAALLFYILTVVGIFVLRKKSPNTPRPYRAVGYPFLPALYVALAGTMMAVLLIYKPMYTWPGLLIVLTGVPVFYIWKRA
jgi:basic amino acid/polyamine antiporter, APA family